MLKKAFVAVFWALAIGLLPILAFVAFAAEGEPHGRVGEGLVAFRK